MSPTLECPACEAPAFTGDAHGMFAEDDETSCSCGARLIVMVDDGEDCDCEQEGGCGLCDEWGQVHEAYVTVLEHEEEHLLCSST